MSKISILKGRAAEYRAKKYLQRRGLRFVTANYRSRDGEIDLIMRDGDTLVFVEVRCRKNSRYGNALESIDRYKVNKIIAVADQYLSAVSAAGEDLNARFDLVVYNHGLYKPPCWIKNAFYDEKTDF